MSDSDSERSAFEFDFSTNDESEFSWLSAFEDTSESDEEPIEARCRTFTSPTVRFNFINVSIN